MTELESLREVRKAAEALMEYEASGGPDFPEWDRLYDALKAALALKWETYAEAYHRVFVGEEEPPRRVPQDPPKEKP